MALEKYVLLPDRIRSIKSGFSFIPHRFLREGFFITLSRDELVVYFLLILVSDREGVSYYSQDRLCHLLKMCLEDFLEARNRLIEKDLIAFDGFIFQVLSLPGKPVHPQAKLLTKREDFERSDPLTIRRSIEKSLSKGDDNQTAHALT